MFALLLCLTLAQKPLAQGLTLEKQPAFDVATVRPSASTVGHDGTFTVDPQRYAVRNATLKRLRAEAWQLPYSQINGPAWLDSNEFDIEARPAQPATNEQYRVLLKALLTERFHLKLRVENRTRNVYELIIAKGGPKLRKSVPGEAPGTWRFRGEVSQFAARLSLLLATPVIEDPTRPSQPNGAPVPIVDKTNLEGEWDFVLTLSPESGGDAFTHWQRKLQDELGLSLRAARVPVEFLVVQSASNVPLQN